MTDALPIGLDAWIIQDGNYPDFEVGQERSFALQFYAREPLTAVRTPGLEPRHIHRGEADFEVVGRSIFNGPGWCALDFGVPAYSECRAGEGIETGSVVAALRSPWRSGW